MAVLLAFAATAFADGPPADTQSLSKDRAAQRSEQQRAELTEARKALAQEDWPRALQDWHELFVHGNAEAPVQLCRMYFDAREGSFETEQVTQWCRLAASANDPGGLYRMGLLYLAGLGVDHDFSAARTMCAAALAGAGGDDEVAAGFCLAVAAKAQNQAALDSLRLPPVPPKRSSDQDPARSEIEQCYHAFAANIATFDPAATSAACGQAAAAGDAGALYRLGLMELLGMGGPQDLAGADRDCATAQERGGGHLSAAYCTAAVPVLRASSQELALARRLDDVDVNPVTGEPLPKTEADPYLADRLLDAPHKTDTGLTYTCRDMQFWALYEAPGLVILEPHDQLFGRKIVDYRAADFAALDRGADECTKAVSQADRDGTLRHDLTTFRTSLASLEMRRAALVREQAGSVAEASLEQREDRIGKADVIVLPSFLSTHEGACISEIRRVWIERSAAAGQHDALEIESSVRTTENGHYVVRGQARAVETDDERREVRGYDSFTCTFKGDSAAVATAVLDKEALSQLQAAEPGR